MYIKTDHNLISPIDVILYYISSKISGFFHNLGFIPNDITTFSFLSAIIGLHLFNNNFNINIVICCFILSYFFDCLDGTMARKYNQETVFGDFYDHITDWISAVFLFYIVIKHTKHKNQNLIILSIILLLTTIYTGCQEKLLNFYQKNPSQSLSGTKFLCKGNEKEVKNKLKFFKFFGIGTFIMTVLILIKFR